MKREEPRKLRTTADLIASRWTRERIRREVKDGKITRIVHGVYGEGDAKPSPLDIGRATALACDGVAEGLLAGEILGWDSVRCTTTEVVAALTSSGKRPGVKRVKHLPTNTLVIDGVTCTDGPTTLWELAHRLDDATFEQALESALRKDLVGPDDLVAMAADKSAAGERVRRMLTLRDGFLTPPTGSLLETLAVQLFRTEPTIPTPTRQLEIFDEHGVFAGRPDLCWPEFDLFLELDGQQHKDQPVYDARRQTRITIATGWRCARLTWDEVTKHQRVTASAVAQLLKLSA